MSNPTTNPTTLEGPVDKSRIDHTAETSRQSQPRTQVIDRSIAHGHHPTTPVHRDLFRGK